MREAKKITYAIMMVLPILPIVVFVLTNIGGESNELLSMGTVQLFPAGSTYYFQYEAGTLAEVILDPIFGQNPLGGIFSTLAGMMVWFESNVGVPVCLPTVYVWLSLLYYAFVAMAHSIVELITFVPRKCAEIFR